MGAQILLFLDGYLKGDGRALEELRSGDLQYKLPNPVAPTARQLVKMLQREGAEKMRQLLAGIKPLEPNAFHRRRRE
jgi:hypothetical protein